MPRRTRWDRVRHTAAALFAANGYAAASVSQLARVSRLSKPGIYYHVRDKEELLFRICESAMAGLLDGARAAAAAAGDPLARLRGVLRAHVAHYWEHAPDHVILFGQMRYLSPARQQRVVALERAYLDLVRDIVRAGQRRGVFRRIDPTLAAFSLFAMLNTLDGWYDRTGRLAPDELVAGLECLYLGGLAAPGRRRPRRRPGTARQEPRRPT
jgi:AcrR family transcriptional regulator